MRPNWVILVIDMQVDFMRKTEWCVPDMRRIIAPIRRLTEKYSSNVIYTRYVNPMNHHFSQWKLCMRGTDGVEIIRDLKPHAKKVFDKTTFSCIKNHELLNHLIESGISKLYFAGVETDVCVFNSMLDAFEFGFQVNLLEDASASSLRSAHRAAVHLLKKQISEDAVIDVRTLMGRHRGAS